MSNTNDALKLDEQQFETLVEAVKSACARAVVDGYENAAMAGLCHEGAFEAAVSAIQMVDVDAVRTYLREDTG